MKQALPLAFLCLLISVNLYAQSPERKGQEKYVPGVILFKLREQYRSLVHEDTRAGGELNQLLEKSGGGTLRKNFPAARYPGKKKYKNGNPPVDLSRIYEFRLNRANLDIDSLCSLFMKSQLFDYAQPRLIYQPLFTPNDPQVAQQYHHTLIKSFEAWDIQKGDTNVCIGITDGGIQFNHNDLGDIRYNYADPINGIDDDGDGYTDNFRGWNSANNTNDPTATISPHGIFTTGMSSATVHNNTGVAGLAYKCKYLPVRIDDASGFNYGYEGIVYAADMGCDVINASWGNTRFDAMGQDAVRYAQERNCLIVSAAGNSGLNEKYYPASYPGVVNVAASGPTDIKWSGSTFSHRVDLIAPGENVRSTWPFNGYNYSSGTSFAAPLVSAAAALVKSQFPAYSAEQLAERLRVTADTGIYQLSGNSAWYHLLGAGRLNVARALSAPEMPSVRFTRNAEEAGEPSKAGDTIAIRGIFKNYLAATKNLQANLQSTSPFVEVIDGSFTGGRIETGDTVSNRNIPFLVYVKENAPYNLDVVLEIVYSDTGYRAFDFVELRVNHDYLDIRSNNLVTTATSTGNIGYAEDYALAGSGIQYKNQQLIYYSGLMLGSSAERTADNAYAKELPGYDHDFVRLEGARRELDEANGSEHIKSSCYTDSASGQRIEVRQEAVSDTSSGLKDIIILHYTLINRGSQQADNLYAGIFADFDIRNAYENQAGFDSLQRLIYAFDTAAGGVYAGIRQLGSTSAHAYAFNSDGLGGSLDFYDGFSNEEKFGTLSGAFQRGQSQVGDVAGLIGTQSFSIAAGDSVKISFALLAADSYNELLEKARQAQGYYHYQSLNVFQSLLPLTCDEAEGSVQLNFQTTDSLHVSLLNSDRVVLARDSGELNSFAYYGLPSGSYSVLFSFSDQSSWETGFSLDELKTVQVVAEANPPSSSLPNAEIQFTAQAENATQFEWDFGDGQTSVEQNPLHTYEDTGVYHVRVIAVNAWCSDTLSMQVIIEAPTRIQEIQAGLRLFPQPANDFIQLEFPSADNPIPYSIYHVSGKICSRGMLESAKQTFSLSKLSPGMYFLNIEWIDGQKVLPFVIAR